MSDARTNDVIIVGGGPAGLAAAIYARRAGLSPLVVEASAFGGQIATTDDVDNYPGLELVSGPELGERLRSHAEHLGADFSFDLISAIRRDEQTRLFSLQGDERSYACRSVIYAAGARQRQAGFAGEERFRGRGVSYCATCDGMFYKGKEVFVVGGGNTACEEALYLSKLASNVTLVVRRDRLRAVSSLANAVTQTPDITVRYLTRITEVCGDGLPETIVLASRTGNNDGASETSETLELGPGAFGVFVAVGQDPQTSLVDGLVDLATDGHVLTGPDMSTRTPGLYCAGDVRDKPLRQVVTAVSDGAIAAMSVAHYLEQ